MIPAAVAAGVGAGSSLIGSIISGVQASRARREAEANLQRALEEIENMPIPDEEKMRLSYEAIGEYTPELLREEIPEDPRLKTSQMEALSRLEDMYGPEMTEAERAGLTLNLQQAAMAEKAARDATLRRYTQRGLAGSGLEMAQAMEAAQGSAQRRGEAALAGTMGAQERALRAISQGSGLAGNIRGQDFARQQALNAIRQFNIQNINQAALRNLMTKMDIEKWNRQAYMDRIAAEQAKARAKAGAYTGMSDYLSGRAGQMTGQAGDFLSGLGQSVYDIGRLANLSKSMKPVGMSIPYIT